MSRLCLPPHHLWRMRFGVVCLLVLSFRKVSADKFAIPVSEEGNSTSLVLAWEGGKIICEQCQSGEFDNDSYACNNGDGNFSNGEKSFIDPLPPATILVQVQATIYGQFNCDNQPAGARLLFSLDDEIFQDAYLPKEPSGCTCPHCVVPFEVTSSIQPSGWDNYNYNGTNTFSVRVEAGNDTAQYICISSVNLTFTFTYTGKVGSIEPRGGPTTGGTIVTVFAENNDFDSSMAYGCLFGDQMVNGTTLGGMPLRCNPSPHLAVGSYPFRLKVITLGIIVDPQIDFHVYVNPNLTGISVPNGDLNCNGSQTILVYGVGFIDIGIGFICDFGNSLYMYGFVINESAVNCSVPQASSIEYVRVSLDAGYHWTNKIHATCGGPSPTPTPPGPPPGHGLPGWAWIALVFGGATFVVVAILFLSKKWKKQPPDGDLANASTRLLNPDGTPNNTMFVKRIDINDIKILQRIGKGTFGEVFKGVWNGTEVGVKFLTSPNMNDQFLQDFYKEVLIMRSLRHPNILQFLGACTNPPNICIIMEYMPMGSLFKILHDETVKKLEIDLLRRMMLDAAKGMNYLHRSDPVVIHRDLKSHNLLVDENWKVKVCDFGLSKILETQSDFTSMTACGTPSWTAPEILRNEKYTEKADVYSFGVVLWECVSREDPYYGMPPFQVVLAVGTKGMRPLIPESCPSSWSLLITECWSESPDKRPSFDEIITRLEEM